MTREDLSLADKILDPASRSSVDLPGMRLLVLHGSRARGDAGPQSDWDFGYLAGEPLDPTGLLARLTMAVGTDAVDLVDLSGASALLRFRAARDGVVLLERPAGAFAEFQLEAVRFWCDAGPVIRAAQVDVLAALG
ncbi:MAG: type VII toxin-antitoxin system MntA family adenylyltransferase antitoxin [Pseudonocardiaceae bacterium]